MRLMSFAMTTDAILDETKDVTRRIGWAFLKRGDLLVAVKQSQGLKKGEAVERLKLIRVVDVRLEPLDRMLDDLRYGWEEVRREGFRPLFGRATPQRFVDVFRWIHKINAYDEVRRIEFKYERVEGPADTWQRQAEAIAAQAAAGHQ